MNTRVIICPVCGHTGPLGPGPGGRPAASCGGCGSLERHRALVGLLPALRSAAGERVILDVAPTPLTSAQIQGVSTRATYVSMDFDPGADKRSVNVQGSLTDIPLPDRSVGLLVCFHVLEHVPDDKTAMTEIARVLAPDGVAVVQVPRRHGRPTDEDPAAGPEERVRRFGQIDHVRYYGDDFEQRLESAGLQVRALTMSELYATPDALALGIVPGEEIWLLTTRASIDTRQMALTCTLLALAAKLESESDYLDGALARLAEADLPVIESGLGDGRDRLHQLAQVMRTTAQQLQDPPLRADRSPRPVARLGAALRRRVGSRT